MVPQRMTDPRVEDTWVTVPGGSFTMGSDSHYPEEAPAHRREVQSFRMQSSPVTNRQFAKFVAATDYVTVAERTLPRDQFPQLAEVDRQPGSLVFMESDGPVDLSDWTRWWRWVPGASWRSPFGPNSSVEDCLDHPVTQVSFEDALAYCAYIGARLPSEAEHEYASAGGTAPSPYAWGTERDPGGVQMANTWRGDFPYRNEAHLGFAYTSPVGSYPPNGFGLYDLIGNVWEWTIDRFTATHTGILVTSDAVCNCSPQMVADTPTDPRRVLKGGSHLCAPEYCHRYRPAARSAQSDDSATTHIGFRPVLDLGGNQC